MSDLDVVCDFLKDHGRDGLAEIVDRAKWRIIELRAEIRSAREVAAMKRMEDSGMLDGLFHTFQLASDDGAEVSGWQAYGRSVVDIINANPADLADY